MLPINRFTFSRHALGRMLDMGVGADEVRDCLGFPRRIHPSGKDNSRSLYFGDRITCVVNDEDLLVVTVVWRTDEGWKADLDAGEYGGRDYRGVVP